MALEGGVAIRPPPANLSLIPKKSHQKPSVQSLFAEMLCFCNHLQIYGQDVAPYGLFWNCLDSCFLTFQVRVAKCILRIAVRVYQAMFRSLEWNLSLWLVSPVVSRGESISRGEMTCCSESTSRSESSRDDVGSISWCEMSSESQDCFRLGSIYRSQSGNLACQRQPSKSCTFVKER